MRASLPKASVGVTDVYCWMQHSLVLGQLDQMLLFEGTASIHFPLRKSPLEENLSAVALT